MTPLRQQMIDAMSQRGFSPKTHKSYLGAVRGLARYFHQPPDHIQASQIQDYFIYLVQERGLCGASCRLNLNGLRFFICKFYIGRNLISRLSFRKRHNVFLSYSPGLRSGRLCRPAIIINTA